MAHKSDNLAKVKISKKMKKKLHVAHPVFPSGLPPKYWPGSTLLNFRDLTRPGEPTWYGATWKKLLGTELNEFQRKS